MSSTMRVSNVIIAALVLWAGSLWAHIPGGPQNAGKPAKNVQYRGVCAASRAQIDQEINNVRARLLAGGDCWWDFRDGRYIVPKVDPATGQREVSSLFSGSVWLGGVDPAGNLKLACQDYRPGGRNDFWPGPLNEQGITDDRTCADWDRHFRVTGDEIRQHLGNLANGTASPENIPRGLKGWPSRGNPFFFDVWGFPLPFTSQGLAGFYDANEDGLYNPLDGDYPSIEIRGCPLDQFPDEMIFWIYNDQGGGAPHARTNGVPIQMEVQVQAFGYVTSNELNDMTFQRYKLINRAVDRIDSTFFAMWTDPDLGCYQDDYIGCDSAKSLMYCYNQDATDGQPGCDCAGVATYCNRVPIIGIDYFRGPLDEFGEEIGMSSFVSYNNPSVGTWPAAMTDPQQPAEFYNYLTGRWRDGTPITYGGSGYNPGSTNLTRYVFHDPPNNPNGWSMCTANLAFGDRRTLQASGPFRLLPGAVNELIIGIPWVPDIDYPCPDLEQLFRADKFAQGMFDNCFDLLDGPDAPTVDWVELNQELIAVLTNENPVSNNYREGYREVDILAPDSLRLSPDPEKRALAEYRFEGYLIYQLINPNVSIADLDDPSKARIVQQVDIKNGVADIYNWEEVRDPNDPQRLVYYPVLMVKGADQGLRHTFRIAEDRFATGNDKRLINHKKYYYTVIAYAYNQYGPFKPYDIPVAGQQYPFLAGRKAPTGPIPIYTVVPRPIVDRVLNSVYGDGVPITRLEGTGNNGNFLELEDDSREALFSPGLKDTTLTYRPGRGPISVTIFNPLEVKDGEYELRFVDRNPNDDKLDPDARWELRRLPDGQVIASERTIAELNEQIVPQYGFSVTVAQVPLTGSLTWSKRNPKKYPSPGEKNGAIGATVEYADPNVRWLEGFSDQETGIFNYVKTGRLERDEEFDPHQGLSTLGNGWFVPYVLCDWALTTDSRMITPAWTPQQASLSGSAVGGSQEPTNSGSRYFRLANLPNVDIVLTPDPSKWSRCIVIESASLYYTGSAFPKKPGLETQSNPNTPTRKRSSFDVRYAPSVSKVDTDGDGLPDPDGSAVLGMGWFPGYAVEVETGRRLNIFFGENSAYSRSLDPNYTGRDMLWNPTDQFFTTEDVQDYYDLILGGQHWVYVTYTTYDSCEALRRRLTPELASSTSAADVFKVPEIRNIAWAGMLMLAPGYKMKPLREGLIPTETVIKLRVNRPFDTWYNDADGGKKTGHPRYRFKIEGRQTTPLDAAQVQNALDSIKVVPNPYYGYSPYETSQFSNVVKITNLPAKCTVTIYSLDGRFIRQYRRDEVYEPYRQISPDLEWDLKNNKGIPVASGVYLIHVSAPGMGERTIKWFGIARQFDPSGL